MFGLYKRRRAFTIVELLVVISIIGVLIGMLLPAVNAAREAGRRTQCSNNMKQLSLAMLNYESKYNYLPNNHGWGVPEENAGLETRGYSWISKILPYMEGGIIFNRIKFMDKLDNKNDYQYTDENGKTQYSYNNLEAGEQKVNIFICPSDSGGTSTTTLMFTGHAVGTTNYKACAGSNWQYSIDPNTRQVVNTPIPATKGRFSSLMPVSLRSDGRDHGNGIICRNYFPNPTDNTKPSDIDKPKLTAILDIRDGTSHTFAIGEAVVTPSNHISSNYNGWYWFNGTTATCAIPLNYLNPTAFPPDTNDWTYTYGFHSQHSVGANFCMCDGSGTFISNLIDPKVYQAMGTIDSSELVSDPTSF